MFSLTRETDTQKKLRNFAKLPFFPDEIDQNANFARLSSAKWLFCINVTFIFQELKFFKAALPLIVSVSLAKENMNGSKELFFFQKNPALTCLSFLKYSK